MVSKENDVFSYPVAAMVSHKICLAILGFVAYTKNFEDTDFDSFNALPVAGSANKKTNDSVAKAAERLEGKCNCKDYCYP